MTDMDAGNIIGVTMYDQSAAFDVCDHYLLIEKLRLLGLENRALFSRPNGGKNKFLERPPIL